MRELDFDALVRRHAGAVHPVRTVRSRLNRARDGLEVLLRDAGREVRPA